MHRYTARVEWHRDGSEFLDNRYARRHSWTFDGGLTVIASSSPQVVPVPLSDPAAIDPEEALVAAASSCHMLWFLSLAARRGLIVDRYVDDAWATMGKDADGRIALTKITLRPRVEFAAGEPSRDELASLHEAAHDSCFIANSLKTPIVIEHD
ncbi:MAG TPA: OsmC family protein [Candidatus Saccharimonadia bacterium]|nr:OsmC family protein [Candidatus Saccharimonadia bacterium]